MKPSGRMSVLAVVQYGYDKVPAQRYRIEEWQPLLARDHGIDLTYTPFIDTEYETFLARGHTWRKGTAALRGFVRRLRDVASSRRWDAVYILREAAAIGPAFFESLFAHRAPYVFDFDDAIFLPQVSGANAAFGFLKSHRKIATICRLAAHVMAGNDYLAAFARQHNGQVTVIPTTVDTEKYRPAAHLHTSIPVIGWSGSPTTACYLREIRPALIELSRTRRFRLHVMGSRDFEPLPGVETRVIPWSAATEVDELSKMDIGLMPLRDDEWARGKCGLKALLHMSLAQPVVCSPVGVNREIVRNGVNGFLASTGEDWVAHLRELLDSPELRFRLGAAGRSTVEERYSAISQVPRVASILHSVRRVAS